MSAPKDKVIFTKSLSNKYAAGADEAYACQNKFMMAHGIVCNFKTKQKRNEWRLSGSSARAFGTIEDLIFMWYNMDISLPKESYQHATTRAPSRHHPLPYLPESLRLKLYPSLTTKNDHQVARFLGAMPPHPKFKTEIGGRSAELSVSLKIQSQNCRRVAIEIWRKYVGERKAVRLGPNDLKSDGLRRIHSSLQNELLPEYMRPKQEIMVTPENNLQGTVIRARTLDYGSHESDPGPYKKKKTMSGTVTSKTLILLFQKAQMNPETVFLDIGSGMGEPMIAAARGFQVQLSLGLEVHKERVQECLRGIIEQGVSRAFPIHVSVEEICHFDPVTHVYCYTNGMDSCTRNCIRESILSSRSVQIVMTDRKDLLQYDGSDVSPFEQVDKVSMVMAASGGYTRNFFVLKRQRGQRIKDEVNFHPIFALPIYTLRFDEAQEQAFLMEYFYMLQRFNYKRLYFCAMRSIDAPATPASPQRENDCPSHITCARSTAEAETESTIKRKKRCVVPHCVQRIVSHSSIEQVNESILVQRQTRSQTKEDANALVTISPQSSIEQVNDSTTEKSQTRSSKLQVEESTPVQSVSRSRLQRRPKPIRRHQA